MKPIYSILNLLKFVNCQTQYMALVLLAVSNAISLLHAYVILNWALYAIHFIGLFLHLAFIFVYLRLSLFWKRFSFQVLGYVTFDVKCIAYPIPSS